MFIKYLEKFQLSIGVISLAIFIVAIVIQISSRYMAISIIWTEEVANYSFIWAVFMGASVMVNRREHFSFDFLTKKLKGKSNIYLTIFNDCVLIIFNIAIFYYGLQATQVFWNYNWVALPMMKMGYVWISLPIMGLTMSIYSLTHLAENIKKLRTKEVSE
jgi:TRAP-type C4-dicarboxylate transport system permease small subunit